MPELENIPTPLEPGEAPEAISLELIVDGGAFIKTTEAAATDGVHEEVFPRPLDENGVSPGACKFLIRELGWGQSAQILLGQFRNSPEGEKVFDGLATADRAFLMAIHLGVVKPAGPGKYEPVWIPAQVRMMFDGPHQHMYTDFLRALYEAVCAWNPHASPVGNPTALRRMIRWIG